jgi:protein ImuB
MRLLSLDWPHLPLRLELARRELRADLVVLGGHPWEPGTVLDCSPGCERLGVSRGQALGAAHNLVPEALFLPADAPAYAAAFEAALDRLAQFTPSLEGETDPHAGAFGQALLGIEGLARLWGDEPALCDKVRQSVSGILPDVPRMGVGNTRFGARIAGIVSSADLRSAARGTARNPDVAVRVASAPCAAIPIGDAEVEAAFLAPLSIDLLPADPETRERFRLLGLTSIGQFAALDRSAVLARFGRGGGELLDLARGRDGRILRPRRPIERLCADAELDPPVEELEPLRFVLHSVAGALCEQLAARGAGAGRAVLALTLERAAPVTYEQALPEPIAATDLLERLLLARLEADPPRHPVEKLSLELSGTGPAAGQQLGLFTPQVGRAARLDWQLASLGIRFGSDRVLTAQMEDPEALIADERFSWRPAGGLSAISA